MTTTKTPAGGLPALSPDLRKSIGGVMERADSFDHYGYETWLHGQSASLRQCARERPPNRIYVDRREGNFVAVVGYAEVRDSALFPCACVARDLVTSGESHVLSVFLDDVTDELRALLVKEGLYDPESARQLAAARPKLVLVQ